MKNSLKIVNVGLVGVGGSGGWGHFPGYMMIPDKAKVAAICDTNADAAEDKARLVNARTYSDYLEMLKDPEIDAVDICLPHFLHGKVALDALEAGKHVIVEKPFTTTLEEADAVIAAAKRQNLKLMVAENTRFVNAYEVAKSFVDEGIMGDILFARTYIGGMDPFIGAHVLGKSVADKSNWRNFQKKAGGGAIFDGGVHSFYLLEWMVGRIKSITAVQAKSKYSGEVSEVDDNASGVAELDNGAIANFSITFTTEIPWTERLELNGTRASIIVDMLSERPVQLFANRSPKPESESSAERIFRKALWEEPILMHSVLDWKSASMRKEVAHFVDCVREGREPLVTGEDGRRGIELAIKSYEAARSGKKVAV
jgi:predicted dehydrogenase